ncbi:MAG: hypothetical protein K2V38_10220 [Gemmataceae bacterium]|nr:hypothetical protein [Gemmataceae bacterium]
MDNEVQRASADAWERVKAMFPASYYEGELYNINFANPDAVVLKYSVIGCNSQWDERFARSSGGWVRVMDAEPGAAADGGTR